MALTFKTRDPQGLLAAITRLVKGDDTGWSRDEDGDFVLDEGHGSGEAWMRPAMEDGELRLTILPPLGEVVDADIYARFHAAFLEMVLRHLDDRFTSAKVSAQASADDDVG